MRITVNDRTVFRFPTALAINGLTAGLIRRRLKKEGVRLTGKQIRLSIRALRRFKKQHDTWNLVELDSGGGDAVRIRL